METVEKNKISLLLELKPFKNNQEEKNEIFVDAMKEAIFHHIKNSVEFKKICKNQGFDFKENFQLEQIPYFPVSIFKKFNLISIPENNIFKTIFSSATTSKIPSKIILDRITSERQTKALVSIMSDFLHEKMDFFILDTKETISSTSNIKSRASAIRGFLPFMKSIKFTLNEDLKMFLINKTQERFDDMLVQEIEIWKEHENKPNLKIKDFKRELQELKNRKKKENNIRRNFS